ncbi:uncharacterized protein M421DRAFT_421931, partial [Didymella exigua CBS 183.55]
MNRNHRVLVKNRAGVGAILNAALAVRIELIMANAINQACVETQGAPTTHLLTSGTNL